MSDLTRYRIDKNIIGEGEEVDYCLLRLFEYKVLVPDTTLQDIADAVEGYAFQQGGMSGAIYACDRDEAEYVMIPIEKWDALLEGTDK